MVDWELEDVERRALADAGTFFCPGLAERRSQQVGEIVRLHFIMKNPPSDAPRAERMWVEITGALGDDDCYRGVLTNVPDFIKGIRQGDELLFSPRHIARTVIRQGDPRWVECAEQKVFVSAMAFSQGEMIRFAYREPADCAEDSGWRMFTGHESQDYADDPANIRLCVVGWLLNKEPSLDFFIREPVGTAFERRADHDPWVRVTDWTPS